MTTSSGNPLPDGPATGTAASVLLVDDEAAIIDGLAPFLRRCGFTVHTARDGEEGLAAHGRLEPDIVVSDIMMPHMDGREMVRRIRAGGTWTPVILLTQIDTSFERSAALDEGADDYLSKPFRIAELRARVAAHLRRESRAPRSRIRRGGLDFDLEERAVYCGEEPLHLTRSEYAICAHLAAHPAQTFTKEQIYEAVFGFDGTADSSAITEHIKNIRAKLRAVGLSPIQTVWGVGYKWESA